MLYNMNKYVNVSTCYRKARIRCKLADPQGWVKSPGVKSRELRSGLFAHRR
jgi:hypothetical protein